MTFSGDRVFAPWSSGSELAAIDSRSDWINSEPLSREELKGKVVLVTFWTYSCVNWIRTQPYIRAWAEKYEPNGLVVIGVHSPEFGFEKELSNVRWATEALGVSYPVVTDNEFSVWGAFENQAWPAFYFIDATGRVRHEKFGEGDYEQSERWIQELLLETGASLDETLVSPKLVGLEVAADWNNVKSPETYVGFARTQNFASPGGISDETTHNYLSPEALHLNQWALEGHWTVGGEAISLSASGGRVTYRFHARDLNLVMGPAPSGTSVRFRVLVDGQPPGASRGVDVDEDGFGTIVEQRLYQLIRQPATVIDRHFEIQFLDPGAEVFSFTFG